MAPNSWFMWSPRRMILAMIEASGFAPLQAFESSKETGSVS